ncbi:MAG: chemotaxis-specific protein-glutamate methyltransferase CheB [Desulfamplus sp.]
MLIKPASQIRVLVVDDSLLVREMIKDIIESDPEIVVAGEAADGIEAVSKAVGLKPDIITMDIEMPVLSGLESISRIMEKRPVPILVITSVSGVRTAFEAVSNGALDVIEKSTINPENGARLIRKVKMLAGVDVATHKMGIGRREAVNLPKVGTDHFVSDKNISKQREMLSSAQESNSLYKRGIVAIAASTGGPYALSVILSKLPTDFPVPIVVAQHVAAGFTQGMAEWLDTCTNLSVTTPKNGEIITSGSVYLNPSEYSMKVTRQGEVVLSQKREEQLYHPSCDYLLHSVAESFGRYAVGVILSGMGHDGVLGMKAIQSVGGLTLAQDEKSSVVFGMNGLAVSQGAVKKVLELSMISDYLLFLFNYGRRAAQ